MVDKIVGIFTLALMITALGIAVRPKSQTPAVIKAITSGFAAIQKATYAS